MAQSTRVFHAPHPRHRPRPQPHRLWRNRSNRRAAGACGGGCVAGAGGGTARTARDDPARAGGGHPCESTGCGDHREGLRQRQSAVNAAAGAGAGGGDTLLLGQARGAAICAAVEAGLAVHEYAALRIKQAVAGYGQAEKRQIQAMVQRLLGLDHLPASDAADALACAICHAHSRTLLAAVASVGNGSAPRRRGGAATRRAWAARVAGAR